jgi:hypothetical protein
MLQLVTLGTIVAWALMVALFLLAYAPQRTMTEIIRDAESSKAVGTLAKVITASTYWRCQACGEMWNPERHERTTRPQRRGSSW